MSHDHDPLRPHSHDPNPAPPSPDPNIRLLNGGAEELLTVDYLRSLPQTTLQDCYIVSTGHGTTGPFVFRGPTLAALMQDKLGDHTDNFASVEVVSGDGFGTRVYREELFGPDSDSAGVILLACDLDGEALTREQGLVRLIVPSETDDALRQVKWIGEIRVIGGR